VTVSLGEGAGTNGAGSLGEASGDELTGIEGVIGSAFGDTLTGGTADEQYRGGKGNDLIRGGGGADRYIFARGDGKDAIFDGASTDTQPRGELLFDFGIGEQQLWFERQSNGVRSATGEDLRVYVLGTSDWVTLEDWYAEGQGHRKLATIETADGSTMSSLDGVDNQLDALISAMATFRDGHASFDPSLATVMPTDDTNLNTKLAAAWQ